MPPPNAMRLALPLLLLVLAACPASAQELYLLGGFMEDAHTFHSSYSWQLEYLQALGEHTAFTVSYLNEGHIPDHHRDGQSAQIWTRTNLLDRRLSLAVGAGPYFFFDTTAAKEGASYSNDHDWKAMFSAAAIWYAESRWLFQLRTNWVTAGRSADSLSAVAGIGYQLDSPSSTGPLTTEPAQQEMTTRNELTVFLGRTILNSFASEHSVAVSIEYRRGLWKYVDWTVAWLYEGDTTQLRRDGITTQLWAVREGLDDRLTLGIGGGGYFVIDRRTKPDRRMDETLSGILTLTGSYRFDPHWDARISWNRIVTNYDRDTDVILGGIGYRF